MADHGKPQCGEGEMLHQQLEFAAQIEQSQASQQQRHQPRMRRSLALGAGVGGMADSGQRRLSTGSRVGATAMLDQAPTRIPTLRAKANHTSVLPPNRISAISGSRVVKLV